MSKVQYSHIFVDMDGTLYGQDLTISEVVIKVINGIVGKIGFSICTARGTSEALLLAKDLNLKSPQIVENGARIVDINGKVIQEYFLSEKSARDIFKMLSTLHIWKKVCIDGELVDFEKVKDFDRITKIGLQDLDNTLFEKFDKMLSSYPDVYYSKSEPAHKPGTFSLDISDTKANKEKAINYVINKLGVKRSEVIGIGDSYNDRSLLMASGLKVAMGNAVDEIKNIADVVAPSVEDDGVAFVINKYIKGKV